MSNLDPIRSQPLRWEEPYGEEMNDELVARLLKIAPFSQMNERDFPRSLPLEGILVYDARIVRYEADELIVREGEYGDSAFMLLDGSLRATIDSLPPEILGRKNENRTLFTKIGKAFAQLLPQSGVPETRKEKDARSVNQESLRGVFLQDVPGILDNTRTATINPGELFGELSALTRSPRPATIFAQAPSTLLEIRWQGLRDMMRYTPMLKDHIDKLYRKNNLRSHLRETPLFQHLPSEALSKIADAIEFETYGSFEWRDVAPKSEQFELHQRVNKEPLVIEEGQPADSVLLIRSGFARVTIRHGEGHRTLAYLGKGQVFGAEEVTYGAIHNETIPWRRSLRSVGYLDVLRLPRKNYVEQVLPHLSNDQLKELHTDPLTGGNELKIGSNDARQLDFLVDHRLINGTEAMVIDLDRCTRCDDCVRACATTHNGNPRFVRQGVVHDKLQYTQACMHCVDPVCMIGCPTGAIHRDQVTGAVQINESTCIGCTTCANNCPYNNIQMVETRSADGAIRIDKETGQPVLQATKCDLCVDQMTGPACQNACPHDALVRIDLTLPNSLSEWSKKKTA